MPPVLKTVVLSSQVKIVSVSSLEITMTTTDMQFPHLIEMTVQSNLPYPGALGLGGARNSDLSVSQNTI